MAPLFTIFQLSAYFFAKKKIFFFFFSVLPVSDISPTANLLYDQGPIKYEITINIRKGKFNQFSL